MSRTCSCCYTRSESGSCSHCSRFLGCGPLLIPVSLVHSGALTTAAILLAARATHPSRILVRPEMPVLATRIPAVLVEFILAGEACLPARQVCFALDLVALDALATFDHARSGRADRSTGTSPHVV